MELNYDPLARFGKALVAARQAQGVSQEKLAYESGVARSYLSGVERGVRNVSLRHICVLAKTLNLHPSELVNFSVRPDE